MSIQNLHIANVGPFDKIAFVFDSRVNVFTGPNNSGKSSVLWSLGDIVACPRIFPARLSRQGNQPAFRISLSGAQGASFRGRLPVVPHDMNPDVREEHRALLKEIGYSKFIPALRRSTDFRSQGPRPSRQRNMEAPDACLISDEAVIQQIIQLHYQSVVNQTSAFRDVMDKIGEAASEITADFPIEFAGIDEDEGGFHPKFTTVDGPVPLNALGQGAQSIVQWLAHLVMGVRRVLRLSRGPGGKAGHPDD